MGANEQAQLALYRAPQSAQVPLEMVWSKRTQGAAFTLACDASGLQDNEIHLSMNIDAGTFSRMKKGAATLSGDKLKEFCEIVGNTVLLDWMAYQVGRGTFLLKSEAERRAENEKARADEAEKKLAWAMELLQGRAK